MPVASQGLRRERSERPRAVPGRTAGGVTATTVSRPSRTATKTYPVIEIFGPTIQGEGAEAGLPTHFVRLGGCDYRCAWCDTMYAVDPRTVRDTAERLSGETIIERLQTLAGCPDWEIGRAHV